MITMGHKYLGNVSGNAVKKIFVSRDETNSRLHFNGFFRVFEDKKALEIQDIRYAIFYFHFLSNKVIDFYFKLSVINKN